jgi:O-antigen/teichoic acid export membrane protein
VTGYGRDIFWAYAVSAARVASWVVVYGTLYRRVGPEAAALLALVRWTLGLLNYASAGLAPAVLHYAAKGGEGSGFRVQGSGTETDAGAALPAQSAIGSSQSAIHFTPRAVYLAGISLSWMGAMVGALILWGWVLTEGRARGVTALVGLFGTGMLIDLAADAWGAVVQSRGRIRNDYQAQAGLETVWAVLATAGLFALAQLPVSWQVVVGGSYLVAALASAAARAGLARRVLAKLPRNDSSAGGIRGDVVRELLTFGGFVVLAQIADYLYAPTDFLLIRALIDLKTVAVYAPAIQMDAGIFLLVGGLSTAVLPMSAAAFGKGDYANVRRYYLLGTAVSFAMLAVIAFLAWVAAPGIFKLWLGSKMRPTQEILPWVLFHTVVGGSAAVGRSVLLAIGKVRAFTAAVLVSGVANVILSYCFVKYGGMGLRGIVLGTIVVVVARCAFWTPWYTLRSLRKLSAPEV